MAKKIKEKKKIDRETNNNVILNLPTVVLQFFLTILIMIFMVITCFKQGIILIILEVLLTLMLFLLSYNNYKIYKRKNFTFIYMIVGFLMLIVTIRSIIKF